jgi:hypothetical protein
MLNNFKKFNFKRYNKIFFFFKLIFFLFIFIKYLKNKLKIKVDKVIYIFSLE